MATKKNQKRKQNSGAAKPTKKSASSILKKIPKKTFKLQLKNAAVLKKSPAAEKKAAAPKKTIYSKTLRSNVLASADVRQQLIQMGGENTIDIIREFDADMTDEELARKTGMKASDVRVVLNRLHNLGLFFYTRMRDKDSGWYSYIWKMNEGKLKEFSGSIESGEQEESAKLAEKEGYRCLSCEAERPVDFETAMDLQFKCSKCGSSLEFIESKKR